MPEITKSYESRDIEKKWYAAWLQAKCFPGVAPQLAGLNPGGGSAAYVFNATAQGGVFFAHVVSAT